MDSIESNPLTNKLSRCLFTRLFKFHKWIQCPPSTDFHRFAWNFCHSQFIDNNRHFTRTLNKIEIMKVLCLDGFFPRNPSIIHSFDFTDIYCGFDVLIHIYMYIITILVSLFLVNTLQYAFLSFSTFGFIAQLVDAHFIKCSIELGLVNFPFGRGRGGWYGVKVY